MPTFYKDKTGSDTQCATKIESEHYVIIIKLNNRNSFCNGLVLRCAITSQFGGEAELSRVFLLEIALKKFNFIIFFVVQKHHIDHNETKDIKIDIIILPTS